MSEGCCRHHVALGDLVADLARRDSRFEVVTPPRFALTCFALKVSVLIEELALAKGPRSGAQLHWGSHR